MYGLNQAGRLSNDLLAKRLVTKWCLQFTHIRGLWQNKWCHMLFSLVVDDFGVKYVGKEHPDHLISAIKEFYPVAEEWTWRFHCCVTLNWYCQKLTVDISVPGYAIESLHKYKHKTVHQQQHSQHKWDWFGYGEKQQMARKLKKLPLIPKEEKSVSQNIWAHFYIMLGKWTPKLW